MAVCLTLPGESQAQNASNNFYDENRPVDTGDRWLNGVAQGTQSDYRNVLHNYLDDLHARINRQLQSVQDLYPSVDFDGIRQWVQNEARDLDRRLFGAQETPSLSGAATQQLVRVTNLNGMGSNATSIQPTAMDDMLMELLNRVSPVPRELPADVEYREVRELVGRLIAQEVQPATIRQQIADRPALARPIARFAVNHPQVLATFPWLRDTLAPYMQEAAREAGSATNASTTNGSSTPQGEAAVRSEQLVFDDSVSRASSNSVGPNGQSNGATFGYDENARVASPASAGDGRNNVASSPANDNTATPTDQPRMTPEQFRSEMQRQTRRFQEADAANQASPLNLRVPEGNQTPPAGDVAPVGVRPQPSNQTYAPRNGNDANGNRPDSTRRQYDQQGYRTQPRQNGAYGSDGSFRPIGQYDAQGYSQQPRQNRVYSSDGSSRPVGRASGFAQSQQQFQQIYQQSQARINAIQANRSQPTTSSVGALGSGSGAPARLVNNEASTSVPSTNQSQANIPAPRQTLVMDDSVPRSRSRFGYDETARVATPAQVAPRQTPAATRDTAVVRTQEAPAASPRPTTQPTSLPQPTSAPAIAPRQAGRAAPTASLSLGR